MYIYNVTIKVNWSIHEPWLIWMREIHIPEVMHTGCFTGYTFARLLETDDAEGPTYVTQYQAAQKEAYDTYITEHAPTLRNKSMAEWGSQFIGFRSLLEVVH